MSYSLEYFHYIVPVLFCQYSFLFFLEKILLIEMPESNLQYQQ